MGKTGLFIYIRRSGKYDNKINQLRKAGNPVLTQDFTDNYALGAEFYKWELADCYSMFYIRGERI